jgi:hypothetical protein
LSCKVALVILRLRGFQNFPGEWGQCEKSQAAMFGPKASDCAFECRQRARLKFWKPWEFQFFFDQLADINSVPSQKNQSSRL